MQHKSVFGDSSGLREMPEHRHCYLKSVKMVGFSSAKSLVELTCYILKNAVSLDCLTLDTLDGFRCSINSRKCYTRSRSVLMEAHRALKAIRSYVQSRSAYLISGLFGFFFQPEQYFSLTTFQPEQCFSASFSQDSASRTGQSSR